MINFEDIHPDYNSSTGYAATNEDIILHRKLLRKVRDIKLAGSIASGGEVPFFVFLSRGIPVVAVDHSYRAIAAVLGKIEIVKRLGTAGAYELFTDKEYKDVSKAFADLAPSMPEKLRPYFAKSTVYGEAGLVFDQNSYNDLRKTWMYVTPLIMKRAFRNLDKLTLVHGDLSDIASKGPFDCLYISNALEHTSYTGKNPDPAIMNDLVKPGGFVLSTGYGAREKLKTGWKLEREVKGVFTSWNHTLMRREA
jgi:hypothetical protein